MSKKSKKPKKPNPWIVLMELISEYRNAAVEESWKGGGDPLDVEMIEAKLKFTEKALIAHVEKMQREFE